MQKSKHEQQRWWSLHCKPTPSTGNRMGPVSALAAMAYSLNLGHPTHQESMQPYSSYWYFGCPLVKKLQAAQQPQTLQLPPGNKVLSCRSWAKRAKAEWAGVTAVSLQCSCNCLTKINDFTGYKRTHRNTELQGSSGDHRVRALLEQFCSRSHGKASISGPDCWESTAPGQQSQPLTAKRLFLVSVCNFLCSSFSSFINI